MLSRSYRGPIAVLSRSYRGPIAAGTGFFGPEMEFFEKNHLASDKSVGFIWTRAAAELSQEMFFEPASARGCTH